MNRVLVLIGVVLLAGGVVLALPLIAVTTTIDETIAASEDFARIFLLPDVPLHLPVGEMVTARFEVSGTAPQEDVLIGLTTNSSLTSVLVNSAIIDDDFTAEGFTYYELGTAEVDEGGLLTFSWFVDSGNPVFFGVFDTDGYLTAVSLLTVEGFQDNALVWGSLSDGIGYVKASRYDDYFFIVVNSSESAEDVTVEVFMVTEAAIPYLESAEGTTQATFTEGITSEDDYRLIVELPDGAYTVAVHGELAPKYPYQLYGVLLLGIGVVVMVIGVLVKPRPAAALPTV